MAQRANPRNLAPDSEVRILMVRLSAIGDVLMTTPVPQALKEAFPRAHITWVVEPLSAPLVQINPYVDEVIQLDKLGRWEKLLRDGKVLTVVREVCAFGRMLRDRHFDLAIDCQGLFKSALLTWMSRAPRRIGYYPPRECNHLFITDRVLRLPHPTRITQPYLSLLEPLGIPMTPRRPVLPAPAEERAAAQAFLTTHGLVGQPYAACCISTSRPQKDWVWSRWRELAEGLYEREGLRTVFIGGPERRVDALRLVEGCPAQPVSGVGTLSLLQSLAVVQDAAVVIGGDTGLTYAGLATDTPTVALYGSTDPTWLTEEAFATVCFHPYPCSPCHRRPTCQHFDCMQDISVGEVLDAVTMMLEKKGRVGV